ALGAVAAAATFAAVMAFGAAISAERGAEEIGPEGAVALLHPKEMVLPAATAEAVRRMAQRPAQAADLVHAAEAEGIATVPAVGTHALPPGAMVVPAVLAASLREGAVSPSGTAAQRPPTEAPPASGAPISAAGGAEEVPTGTRTLV